MTLSMLALAFLAGLRAHLKEAQIGVASGKANKRSLSARPEGMRDPRRHQRAGIAPADNPSPKRPPAEHQLSLGMVDLATPSSSRSQARALSKTNHSNTTVVTRLRHAEGGKRQATSGCLDERLVGGLDFTVDVSLRAMPIASSPSPARIEMLFAHRK
jgi:hypothetical protein